MTGPIALRNTALFLWILWGAMACTSPWGICGNGEVENGEDCDGDAIAPILTWSCKHMGYHTDAKATCSQSCRLDLSVCRAAGFCGDGILQSPYEECDQDNLGDVTCESLGHYDGHLRCTSSCRLDDSGCRRCGDGILDTDMGELVETGYSGCEELGFYGGFMYTTDCRTPDHPVCGEFRVFPMEEHFETTALAVDDSGNFWMAGVMRNSPEEPCPLVPLRFHDYPYEQIGFEYDPACTRTFAARMSPDGQTQILWTTEPEDTVRGILPHPDHGISLLHMEDYRYSFSFRDMDGEIKEHQELGAGITRPEVFMHSLGDQTTGLVRRGQYHLEFLTFHPDRAGTIEAFRTRGTLTYFDHQHARCSMATSNYYFYVRWSHPDEVLVMTLFTCTNPGLDGWYVVRMRFGPSQSGIAGLFRTVIPQEDVAAPWYTHLGVDPETDEIMLAHLVRSTPEELVLVQERIAPDGTSTRLDVTPLDKLSLFPWSRLHVNDSGWALVPGYSQLPGNRNPDESCPHHWGCMVAQWVSPQGQRMDPFFYPVPGLFSTLGHHYSNTVNRVNHALSGSTLFLAGAYNRGYGFADPREPLLLHWGWPVHSAGFHLLRMKPPHTD